MDYRSLDPLRHPFELRQCLQLARLRLGPTSGGKLLKTLRLHRQRRLHLCLQQDRVVGFKLGYTERPGVFYSWMGAVDQELEGRGIARQLMALQHGELRQRGFRAVRTHTSQRFTRMLILNLRAGFSIVGLKHRQGEPLLLLEKRF